jgi:hypothetical protein
MLYKFYYIIHMYNRVYNQKIVNEVNSTVFHFRTNSHSDLCISALQLTIHSTY